MWRVYVERAGSRLGVYFPGGAEVLWFHREMEARAAFRRAVRALLEDGFEPVDTPQAEGVEELVVLERGDGAMALALLSREGEE